MKKFQYIVSALGIAVLGGIFYFNLKINTAYGLLAAVMCVTVFAVLCLRFLPVWVGEWTERKEIKDTGDEPENMGVKIFVSLILWSVFVMLLHFVLRGILQGETNFINDVYSWNCTDSMHYLSIAREGYLSWGEWDKMVLLVFLPGYPMVVGLINKLVGNMVFSAMLVSSVCFALSGCILYRLARLDYNHRDSLRSVKYLCILPAAFFFTAPMSESLFLLCCLSCVYFVRKGKITVGCLFGCMAAFTRSLGVVLVAVLLFDFIAEFIRNHDVKSFTKNCLNLIMIPLGFGLYCCINYDVSGEFFKFMEYQKLHWGQSFGWFFNTPAYQTEYAVSAFSENSAIFFGLWLPNLIAIFASLVIMVLAVKKIKGSYTAYFIGYFVISIGATWLLSAPRYMTACFVLPIALSQITKNKKADFCISAFCLLGYLLYFIAFVNRWQVW